MQNAGSELLSLEDKCSTSSLFRKLVVPVLSALHIYPVLFTNVANSLIETQRCETLNGGTIEISPFSSSMRFSGTTIQSFRCAVFMVRTLLSWKRTCRLKNC